MIGKYIGINLKTAIRESESHIVSENKEICTIESIKGEDSVLVKIENKTYKIEFGKDANHENTSDSAIWNWANSTLPRIYNEDGEKIGTFEVRSAGEGITQKYNYGHGSINGVDFNYYIIGNKGQTIYVKDENDKTVGAIEDVYNQNIYVEDEKWFEILCLVTIIEAYDYESKRLGVDGEQNYSIGSATTHQKGLLEKEDKEFIERIKGNTKTEDIPENTQNYKEYKEERTKKHNRSTLLIFGIIAIAAIMIVLPFILR